MENIKQIKQLLVLLDKREQVYLNVTEEIIALIGPTALTALYKFFGTSDENVVWLDVQLVERIILLVVSVTYNAGEPVPELVERISPTKPIELEAGTHIANIQRLMRIGIPIEMVFQPTAEIATFLDTRVRNQPVPEHEIPIAFVKTPAVIAVDEVDEKDDSIPINVPSTTDFNKSLLTKDQVEQLVFYQHQMKGTKH